MNTIKNILFFGLLLAVLCLVYVVLNKTPEPTLPPGLNGDTRPPKIEIPGADAPLLTSPSSAESSNMPSLPSQPPRMFASPPGGGGTAPPFQPPMTRGSRERCPLSVGQRLGCLGRPAGLELPAGREESVCCARCPGRAARAAFAPAIARTPARTFLVNQPGPCHAAGQAEGRREPLCRRALDPEPALRQSRPAGVPGAGSHARSSTRWPPR